MAYFNHGQQNKVLAISLTTYIIKKRRFKNMVDQLSRMQNSVLHYQFFMVNIMYFCDKFYYFVGEMFTNSCHTFFDFVKMLRMKWKV